MKGVNKISIEMAIKDAKEGGGTQVNIGGAWVEARPIGLTDLPTRIKLAWGVFTGKYDALEWFKQ